MPYQPRFCRVIGYPKDYTESYFKLMQSANLSQNTPIYQNCCQINKSQIIVIVPCTTSSNSTILSFNHPKNYSTTKRTDLIFDFFWPTCNAVFFNRNVNLNILIFKVFSNCFTNVSLVCKTMFDLFEGITGQEIQ